MLAPSTPDHAPRGNHNKPQENISQPKKHNLTIERELARDIIKVLAKSQKAIRGQIKNKIQPK